MKLPQCSLLQDELLKRYNCKPSTTYFLKALARGKTMGSYTLHIGWNVPKASSADNQAGLEEEAEDAVRSWLASTNLSSRLKTQKPCQSKRKFINNPSKLKKQNILKKQRRKMMKDHGSDSNNLFSCNLLLVRQSRECT